jgi:hypothetical protein
MMNTIFTRMAVMAAASLLTAAAAEARVYAFDYEADGGALSLAGEMTVDPSGEVTAMTGDFDGGVVDTISTMIANPSFPGAAYSPDGAFIYNNAFYSAAAPLDVYGVLFTTALTGGYWNLWNNGSDFSLWQAAPGGGYAVQTTGQLTIAAVPEMPTWAMAAAGFAFLGYSALRRPRQARAIA